jgi:hypothetical protein
MKEEVMEVEEVEEVKEMAERPRRNTSKGVTFRGASSPLLP